MEKKKESESVLADILLKAEKDLKAKVNSNN